MSIASTPRNRPRDPASREVRRTGSNGRKDIAPDEDAAEARINHLSLDVAGRIGRCKCSREVLHVDFAVLLPVWTGNVRNATREPIPGTTERRFAERDKSSGATPKVGMQIYLGEAHCLGRPIIPSFRGAPGSVLSVFSCGDPEVDRGLGRLLLRGGLGADARPWREHGSPIAGTEADSRRP